MITTQQAMAAIDKVQTMIMRNPDNGYDRDFMALEEQLVAITHYRHSVHFQYNFKMWMLESLNAHSNGTLDWRVDPSGDVVFMRTKTTVEIDGGHEIRVDVTFCITVPKDEQ